MTKLERIDYAYDFRGQLLTTTAWSATTTVGAGAGTPSITRFVYDQRGNLLQTIEARGEASADNDYFTNFTYDGLNRLLTATEWIDRDAYGAAITRTTINQYDDAGNRTVTTILSDNVLNRAAITTPVAGWSPNAALLETDATAATTPKLAFDQNGDGIAVWVQGNVIYYSTFTRSTGQWSSPEWVAGNSSAPNAVHLSMSANGNVVVSWRVPNPTNGSIFARTRVNGVWDSNALIPGSIAADSADPIGAINNAGQAMLIYRQATSGTTQPYSLYAARFSGGSWGSSSTLIESNANTIATPASLALDSAGDATVLWLQKISSSATNTSVYFARFTAASSTWSTPSASTLENTTAAVSSPKIAFDANGNGIAVWIESNRLYAKTYTKSTNAWSAAKLLENSSTTVIANSANVSMSTNGNALVTWRQNSAGVYARRYINGVWQNSASNADTGDWVSNNTGTTYNPVGVINDAGQAAVAFLQNVSSRVNTYVTRFTASWSTPELVENSTIGVPTASTNGPNVALDNEGNVSVTWIQSDGSANSVYTNRFEANPSPSYAVPSGSTTWDDIAETLYGVRSLGNDLQAALGSPTLGAGVRLTNLPARLTDLLQTSAATAARVTNSLYNRAGELISIANAGPGATNLGTTSYRYDANGNLRIVTDPTGVSQFHLYDDANRKVADIDGDGTLTAYSYDGKSQLVRMVRYADLVPAASLTSGSSSSLIDASGNPTNVTLATVISVLPTTVGRANDQITRNVYNNAGQLIYTIDASGAVSENVYNGKGERTDVVGYGARLTVPIPNTVTELRLTLAVPQLVDPLTNITYEIDTDDTDSDTDKNRRIRYFYDNDGLLRGTLDAEGYLSEAVYDSAGRVIQTIAYANATAINPDGSVDSALRLTGTLDQLRASAGTDNETALDPEQDAIGYLFYDGQGRQIGELDAEHYFTETQYDLAGRVSQTIRYDLQIGYAQDADPFQRIKNIATTPRTPPTVTHVTTFVYDGVGRLVQEFNYEGTVTIHGYDVLDNLTGTARAYGTAEVRTAQARYDALGRVTQELSGAGSTALAALVNPTQADIEDVWTKYGVRYTYDLAGRRLSATSVA
jgi:YD repeat-containing protein